jgi:hypothetical protein
MPSQRAPDPKGSDMKIKVENNLVEFVPESDTEIEDLSAVWNVIVDCVKFNKKLVPVGEYIPQKKNCARFVIEGLKTDTTQAAPEVRVDKDCTCYCQQCNKYINLKKNDRIPMCCGKIMEILD